MSKPCPLDRRRLLQLAAAGATGMWLPGTAVGQRPLAADPFGLGIASGSPTHNSVVLWTRLIAPGIFQGLGKDAIPVRWELAHDEQFSRIVQRGQAAAFSELAHSVHVEVAGLEPDRWYFYRFIAGDAVSPTGRTRTFPAPDAVVQKLRLAYASCQRWEHGYYAAYRHMRDENLDAVLFVGDYIYEYPISAKPVRVHTGGWLVTLDDYRQRYAVHKSDADLQGMHAACPWVHTWDDHEVQNDYASLTPGNSGRFSPPDSIAEFPARRAAAYQAYYEHMPLRASVLTRGVAGLATGAEMRIYSQQRLGQLATLYVLDSRQYRDAHVCTPGSFGSAYVNPAACPGWDDPKRSLLGAAQEQWLDAALAVDGGIWSVIAQQTLFGRRAARGGLWNDGWDGYGAARTRLTDALQRHRVANPVLLGGDVHENWVGHVKADYARPESATVGVEFCGTSISSRSGRNGKIPAALLAENPHFVFAESERRGYGVCEFTPERLTTTLRVVNDVRRMDAEIETLARFTVEAGRLRLNQA